MDFRLGSGSQSRHCMVVSFHQLSSDFTLVSSKFRLKKAEQNPRLYLWYWLAVHNIFQDCVAYNNTIYKLTLKTPN
jgi:hypothetical protein